MEKIGVGEEFKVKIKDISDLDYDLSKENVDIETENVSVGKKHVKRKNSTFFVTIVPKEIGTLKIKPVFEVLDETIKGNAIEIKVKRPPEPRPYWKIDPQTLTYPNSSFTIEFFPGREKGDVPEVNLEYLKAPLDNLTLQQVSKKKWKAEFSDPRCGFHKIEGEYEVWGEKFLIKDNIEILPSFKINPDPRSEEASIFTHLQNKLEITTEPPEAKVETSGDYDKFDPEKHQIVLKPSDTRKKKFEVTAKKNEVKNTQAVQYEPEPLIRLECPETIPLVEKEYEINVRIPANLDRSKLSIKVNENELTNFFEWEENSHYWLQADIREYLESKSNLIRINHPMLEKPLTKTVKLSPQVRFESVKDKVYSDSPELFAYIPSDVGISFPDQDVEIKDTLEPNKLRLYVRDFENQPGEHSLKYAVSHKECEVRGEENVSVYPYLNVDVGKEYSVGEWHQIPVDSDPSARIFVRNVDYKMDKDKHYIKASEAREAVLTIRAVAGNKSTEKEVETQFRSPLELEIRKGLAAHLPVKVNIKMNPERAKKPQLWVNKKVYELPVKKKVKKELKLPPGEYEFKLRDAENEKLNKWAPSLKRRVLPYVRFRPVEIVNMAEGGNPTLRVELDKYTNLTENLKLESEGELPPKFSLSEKVENLLTTVSDKRGAERVAFPFDSFEEIESEEDGKNRYKLTYNYPNKRMKTGKYELLVEEMGIKGKISEKFFYLINVGKLANPSGKYEVGDSMKLEASPENDLSLLEDYYECCIVKTEPEVFTRTYSLSDVGEVLSRFSDKEGPGKYYLQIRPQKNIEEGIKNLETVFEVVEKEIKPKSITSHPRRLAKEIKREPKIDENFVCEALIVVPERRLQYEPSSSYISAFLQDDQLGEKSMGILQFDLPKGTSGTFFESEDEIKEIAPEYTPALLDEQDGCSVIRGFESFSCPNCESPLCGGWDREKKSSFLICQDCGYEKFNFLCTLDEILTRAPDILFVSADFMLEAMRDEKISHQYNIFFPPGNVQGCPECGKVDISKNLIERLGGAAVIEEAVEAGKRGVSSLLKRVKELEQKRSEIKLNSKIGSLKERKNTLEKKLKNINRKTSKIQRKGFQSRLVDFIRRIIPFIEAPLRLEKLKQRKEKLLAELDNVNDELDKEKEPLRRIDRKKSRIRRRARGKAAQIASEVLEKENEDSRVLKAFKEMFEENKLSFVTRELNFSSSQRCKKCGRKYETFGKPPKLLMVDSEIFDSLPPYLESPPYAMKWIKEEVHQLSPSTRVAIVN